MTPRDTQLAELLDRQPRLVELLLAHTAQEAFTVKSFCQAFGVGKTSLYAEIKSGRLKSFVACGRRLIARTDAMAWLAAFREVEGDEDG